MSQKIAAEDFPKAWSGPIAEKPPPAVAVAVVVREYEEGRDKAGVERMEMRCEVTGQRSGPDNKNKMKKKEEEEEKKAFLVTDLLGDPLCRVRSFPLHVMLVAEWGEGGEIVGVIRGCIKRAKITRNVANPSSSDYVKVANVLGLRVSPSHRRHGIATRLVQEIERWCKRHGADYAYMATDATNSPSLKLFTAKCGFIKYRTPNLLVRPVHAHREPPVPGTSIIRITPRLAELMYRRVLAGSDFFPEDMGEIVAHALSLGTFVAIPEESARAWDPESGALPPLSFAVASVWNTKGVYNLQVKGASGFVRACCAGSRMLDSCMPWLRLPSFPNVFNRFGFYFLYGLYMTGKHGPSLMKSLCDFAHNMARDDAGCGAVVAEVGPGDPVKVAIPHWKRFSWSEDVWCIKLLREGLVQKCGDLDWVHMSKGQSPVLFVDPRDV
ncbi:probable N-acetyltransferase HLS1 [Rhodamnia argentea]|uniref:Probable N-acetyltransferase HLS1 n=1 Tax=Rhodamnia argentea TaxID=178133 RepID=A0A8B8QKU3_9MYRT|nr:probable N-acetyltransferase HLS1 [Rhodamnia argentea]